MQLRDILLEKGTNVVTIDASQSIRDAIGRLNENRIGALIATSNGEEVVGIITERDILRKCGEDCINRSESKATKETGCSSLVQDTMTKELIIGALDDDPDQIMGVMTKNRIRHLPILDDGRLAGIISIGDLVNAHLEEMVFDSRTLKNYISRNDTPAQA